MNIYLDIDGVIITKDKKIANGLVEFLEYATHNHTCFWLTTHCKNDANRVEEHIKPILPEHVFKLVQRVKPNSWTDYKTDGINFDEDFMWLDDNLFLKEKDVLLKNNALSKLELIDLRANPNQLLDILKKLKSKTRITSY